VVPTHPTPAARSTLDEGLDGYAVTRSNVLDGIPDFHHLASELVTRYGSDAIGSRDAPRVQITATDAGHVNTHQHLVIALKLRSVHLAKFEGARGCPHRGFHRIHHTTSPTAIEKRDAAS
jgi:hypothetical protein